MKLKKVCLFLAVTFAAVLWRSVVFCGGDEPMSREISEAQRVSYIQLKQVCKSIGGVWVGKDGPKGKITELEDVLPGLSSVRNKCIILPPPQVICP